MKNIRSILFFSLIALAVFWFLSQLSRLPSLSNLFKEQKVQIDKTAVIVTNIKALAQLVTISAYDEIVVDSTSNISNGLRGFAALYPSWAPAILSGEQRLVLIGKTTTHVGIDLQKLRPEDVYVQKDSLHIVLPAAQVLEVILNPSDLSFFEERGTWSNEAISQLKNKITYLAAANAKSLGLLAQSETKAKELLTTFFKALGYNKIGFSFR